MCIAMETLLESESKHAASMNTQKDNCQAWLFTYQPSNRNMTQPSWQQNRVEDRIAKTFGVILAANRPRHGLAAISMSSQLRLLRPLELGWLK